MDAALASDPRAPISAPLLKQPAFSPPWRILDDYRTKWAGDVGMVAPGVVELPPGALHRWMRSTGKLGGQHKVPPVIKTAGRRRLF